MLLEAERAQLAPWFVVGFGSGIAAWFTMGAASEWKIFLCLAAACALAGFAVPGSRAARAMAWFALAAVTSIVALHSTGWAKRLLQRREEGPIARTARALLGIVATGLAVEIALAPLALYHFHRSGLYGVGANIVAIPLTTFVIMPLEAAALALDPLGIPGPFWWLCGRSIDALLGLAHAVATSRGAVALLPSMPAWAFASMVAGGVWLCLWTKRWRLLGLVPAAIGAVGAVFSRAPDLLVTGDGRHLAVVDHGVPYILRDHAGDYVRSLLAEVSGYDSDPELLDE